MLPLHINDIPAYVRIGRKDMHWYTDCQALFEDLFGKDRLFLVCKLFAATSINTSLKANIYLFRKALYEIENNLPIGNYLPNIQQQLRQLRAGEELTGRKINSFARAMSGDKNAVVVDIWLLRAFQQERLSTRRTGPHAGKQRSSGASDAQYTLIENWVRITAELMGVEPRQLSAMIWCGVRVTKSGDRETHYKNLLLYHFTNLFNVI